MNYTTKFAEESQDPHTFNLAQITDNNVKGELRTLLRRINNLLQSLDQNVSEEEEHRLDQFKLVQYWRAQLRDFQERSSIFDEIAASDTAWAMMLEAAICYFEERETSVTAICMASQAPHSTALRTFARLVDEGMLTVNPDNKDKRRRIVKITDFALEKMVYHANTFFGRIRKK